MATPNAHGETHIVDMRLEERQGLVKDLVRLLLERRKRFRDQVEERQRVDCGGVDKVSFRRSAGTSHRAHAPR